ncbi:MAG: GC-type dockerin domain-anchored protein [Phycisphaerales bacterium JB039]
MRRFACLAVAMAPAALAQQSLYATSGFSSPILYELDPATGAELSFAFITGAEAIFSGIAIDDAGDTWAIDGYNDGIPDRLFLIDKDTGAGSVVGETGENWNFRFVCVHPVTDVLYGGRDSAIFTMDRTTGLATKVTDIRGPGLDQLTCLAIDRNGVGWGLDIGDTTLFKIDIMTGAAERIADLNPGQRWWYNDLTFDAAGTLWGAREQGGGVYTIDTATGEATLQFGGSYRGLEFFGDSACYPDCDGSGSLDFFDFLCFQNAFAAGEPYADCDGSGSLDFFDFLCFQNEFAAGCP